LKANHSEAFLVMNVPQNKANISSFQNEPTPFECREQRTSKIKQQENFEWVLPEGLH
jgi:hypothetical protein